jgi:hypothetical protein
VERDVGSVRRGDDEMRKLQSSVLAVCVLLLTAAAFAQKPSDPLSGTWVGDWGPSPNDRNQVTVELKWDGKALSGTVNPGPNAVPLQKATFDPKTSVVHFEAQAKGHGGQELHYKIDGKLDKNTLSGTWNHESRNGDFKITKK